MAGIRCRWYMKSFESYTVKGPDGEVSRGLRIEYRWFYIPYLVLKYKYCKLVGRDC